MKQKIITATIMESNPVLLGLGSNLGNREKNLRNALREISQIVVIKKRSSIYETTPVGYKEQGLFLNMVISIETDLDPTELVVKLQKIEHKMGRNRSKEIFWGPREIDIDILLYKNEIIREKNLKIPHPEMHKRKFVLIPLEEIAPDIIHPKLKKSIKELCEKLKNSEKVTLWTNKK